MKFFIVIFLGLFIYVSSYSQWVQQVSGTTRHLFGIDMIDANTGFVCGDQVGAILKTTNSGINWVLYTEPTNDQYNGISFINALTGLAVGPPGLVLRTSNGGLNWNIVSQPGTDKGPVQFVSQNVAYAAGDDVIKSTDGGLSWFIIRNGTILSQYQGLYFIDDNIGTVVGRPGLIITTTNGGASWTQRTMYLPIQFADSALFDVFYVNSQVGYACGNLGIFVKTTNGGINWAYYATGSSFALYGVKFVDVNIGYAIGLGGRIIKTTNGGINWIQQSSPITDPLEYLDFVDNNNGWIVAFNGKILHTTNGGISWIEPISLEIPNGFKLEQNYPNPFNPLTKIKFQIPKISYVKISITDLLGRECTKLIDQSLKAGIYEVEWNAANESSGIYFYTLNADSYTETKKLVLLK